MKHGDGPLGAEDILRVRAEARRLLDEACAFGELPTPVDRLLEAAKDTLSDSYIDRIRRSVNSKLDGSRFGQALKSAASKILGVFDAFARLIHIDRSVLVVKQTFLKLHETAHGFLTWQRPMYAMAEDCEKHIDAEISDLFEREANHFAAEVLFQLDHFTEHAAGYDFNINVPLNLAKKFGASVSAAIRRYVTHSPHACAVMVLDLPVLKTHVGFQAAVRRVVPSPSFLESVGNIAWPSQVTPDDPLGRMVPLGQRKMSRKQQLQITDAIGVRHECVAEAFKHKYAVFVLILLKQPLTRTTIILPQAS